MNYDIDLVDGEVRAVRNIGEGEMVTIGPAAYCALTGGPGVDVEFCIYAVPRDIPVDEVYVQSGEALAVLQQSQNEDVA